MPRKGGEIDLKPCAYRSVGVLCPFGGQHDGVLFVERTGEFPSVARLSQHRRSRSEGESEKGACGVG